MKKITLLIAAVAMLFAGCGPKRSQAYYNYPSQVLSANLDGSYVIRVQVRSKDAVTAFDDARRKAVKEIIFDGMKAANNSISDLKPLVFDKNSQEKHEDYWNAFFSDNGPWRKFSSYDDRRAITTHYERDGRQMVETGTVTVDRAGIKKKLQEDGIIPKAGRFD